jgi:hypothetical protein
VTADGVVRVVTGTKGYHDITYTTKSSGIWSTGRVLDNQLRVQALALTLDSTGQPHVIVSGANGAMYDPTPPACNGGSNCTLDIAVADPAVETLITDHVYHSLDATPGASGIIDAVGTDDGLVDHLSNSGGSWMVKTIETANIVSASISHGPNGLVAFWSYGTNDGVRRADFDGANWTLTWADHDTAGPDGAGVVDAQDRSHFVATYSYNHPNDGGYLPLFYIGTPDTQAPIVTSLRVRPKVGGVIGTTIPTTVSWAAIDALSGVASYAVRQQTGTSWSTITSATTATSATRSLKAGTVYAFSVRPKDHDGNVGALAATPALKLAAYQESSTLLKYRGTWRPAAGSTLWGGKSKYATSSSASVTITTTMRGFAWVGSYGKTRGSVKISVDGGPYTAVSTYRSSTTLRAIIWSTSWASLGTHTIKLVVAGTAGHPRVDLDGAIVVR